MRCPERSRSEPSAAAGTHRQTRPASHIQICSSHTGNSFPKQTSVLGEQLHLNGSVSPHGAFRNGDGGADVDGSAATQSNDIILMVSRCHLIFSLLINVSAVCSDRCGSTTAQREMFCFSLEGIYMQALVPTSSLQKPRGKTPPSSSQLEASDYLNKQLQKVNSLHTWILP